MSSTKKDVTTKHNILEGGLKKNKMIKLEIALPEEYENFFKYIEGNFGLNRIAYIEFIIKKELNSRNQDLNLF